jgi:hypothetical protein
MSLMIFEKLNDEELTGINGVLVQKPGELYIAVELPERVV